MTRKKLDCKVWINAAILCQADGKIKLPFVFRIQMSNDEVEKKEEFRKAMIDWLSDNSSSSDPDFASLTRLKETLPNETKLSQVGGFYSPGR